MFRLLAGACIVLCLAVSFTAAEDKKPVEKAALSGTWTREANGLDIKFEFSGKDTLKIHVGHDENSVLVTAKYTLEKDGLVKLKITDVEEKGKFPAKPAKGLEFSFIWKVKGDSATLDDLKGENLEDAKPVLEGEYARKAKK